MVGGSMVVFIALGAIFAYSFYAVLVAGQLSLGQAGFASLAGFSAAALAPDPRLLGDLPTLVVAIAIGMAVGALASVVLGLPTMHLRGVFLAIATLGFAEAVRIVLLNQEWTGGAQGMRVPKLLDAVTAWVILGLVAYWFWRMGRSRYGRALAAIREDELAARAMGIDVGRHRLAAFATAGAVAGLYGVLWSFTMRLIVPADFDFAAAVDGLVTAILGGSTRALGPVLGGALQTFVPELQRVLGIQAGWIRPFLSGLLLVAVILFLPGGLAGVWPRRLRLPPADGPPQPAAGPTDGRARPRSHPEAGELVVAAKGLGAEYGGVHAVRGVDLEIRSGETLGLIGPNGAGKTTLVNMLSGLAAPSSGTATVLGIRPGRTPVHAVAAAGVARTFQHSKLFDRLSVLENVLVGAHLVTRPTFLRRLLWLPSARRDEQWALRHAAGCLARVGLAEMAGERASALSYGDQRRLEIARALASDPSLLILDEPAAGMNEGERHVLSEQIRSLAVGGLTILLIEHDVPMVLRICDRVVVLDFGEVIATGTPAEIAADQTVVEAYLGSAHDEPAHDEPADHEPAPGRGREGTVAERTRAERATGGGDG